MFLIRKASSSRIPIPAQPIHRSFNSTSRNLVKRPQKPYEAPVAKIDAYGNRIPFQSQNSSYDDYDTERRSGGRNSKEEMNKMKFLESLSDQRSKSNLEKYGNFRTFGLRGNNKDQHGSHMNEDGYEEDWKQKIGIKSSNPRSERHLKLGRKKFERANLSYLEESKKLNPFQLQHDRKIVDNKLKKTKVYSKDPKYPGGTSLPIPTKKRERLLGEKRKIQDRIQQSRQFLDSDEGVHDQMESRNNDQSEDYRLASSILREAEDSFEEMSTEERNRVGFNQNSEGGRGRQSVGINNGSSRSFPTPKKSFGLSSSSRSANGNSRGYEGRSSSHNRTPVENMNTNNYTDETPSSPKSPSEYWKPTKKLTYSAMAGLKTLYSMDPEKYSKEFLSQKFGISREAVTRILKSKYREQTANEENDSERLMLPNGKPYKPLVGTKWDKNPESSENVSPVPAILRAFGRE